MIETLADGTIIAYLRRGMEPVDKADADLVKVIYPDGTVRWGLPGISKRKHSPEYEAESEKIRENAREWRPKRHRFKAAEWTFPNGHPRCLLCGEEERTGGWCEPGDGQDVEKYSPDQPREPAGSDEGGQFAGTGVSGKTPRQRANAALESRGWERVRSMKLGHYATHPDRSGEMITYPTPDTFRHAVMAGGKITVISSGNLKDLPKHIESLGPENAPGRRPALRPAEPRDFIAARDANTRPRYVGFLSDISEEGLAGHRVFLAEDGKAGFAIDPSGDLQNVFGSEKGYGHLAIRQAIGEGAITLDCFAGKLPQIYEKFGFREVGRMKWDPAQAPKKWNPADDEPDVVFMALTAKEGDDGGTVSRRYYEGGEWDRAKSDARGAAGARRGHGIRNPADRGASGPGVGGVARRADPRAGKDDGRAVTKDYREEEHPRDESGKWTEGGGGGAAPEAGKPAPAKMPRLPRKVMQPIARYEAERRGFSHETATLVSAEGTVMLDKAGDDKSVRFTSKETGIIRDTPGAVFTHNHPNGTSFSREDIRFAISTGVSEIRATATIEVGGEKMNVVYRMRPGPEEFPSSEPDIDYMGHYAKSPLDDMYNSVDAEVYEEFKGRLGRDLTQGEAEVLHHHEIWARLSMKYPQHFIYTREIANA